MKRYIFFFLIFSISISQVDNPNDVHVQIINDIFLLASNDNDALQRLDKKFNLNQVPMYLEMLNFIESEAMQSKIITLLESKSGKKFGSDIDLWYQWIWNEKYTANPYYAEFKAHLYSYMDPKFREYFSAQYPYTIKLDEILWGGVKQNGIPPLENPTLLTKEEAIYLNDSDIVYGFEINGEFRAYPKRIIAWHELITETVNEMPITGVFCSLCGTMIIYESSINGRKFSFGTSGFLYRSNKLMFDKETNSLWSSYYGEPVMGIMVGQGLKLKKHAVVSTTWGKWKKRHPKTKVLEINTGYDRNYSEGEAYKSYFSNDKLMFTIPKLDTRIPNKTEVIAFKTNNQSFALTQTYLNKNTIVNEDFFIAITINGVARIYETSNIKMTSILNDSQLKDSNGNIWTLSESRLQLKDRILNRIPSIPSFWFGWVAAHPDSKLFF